MRNINIVLMAHRRPEFSDLMIHNLAKSKFKDRVHLSILICDQNKDFGVTLNNLAQSLGLESHYKPFRGVAENYMNKVHEACLMPFAEKDTGIDYYEAEFGRLQESYEYSVKLDEDVFLSPAGWDYFIENIPVVLGDPNNVVFTMSLCNGIPTVDHFIQDNMSTEEGAQFREMFSNVHIPNLWGANYEHLNAAIAGNYDSQRFFAAAAQTNHFYKGIHPIRVDAATQKKLNNWILANPAKFFEQTNWYTHVMTEPYFCNSFFAIRTADWKSVITDQSLAKDAFDEVSLNNFRTAYNKRFIIARGGFAIHTLYNTLFIIPGNVQSELMKYEYDFVTELRKVLNAYGESK